MIITVNLTKAQVLALEAICGPKKEYFSRSELARIAVRDWIMDRVKNRLVPILRSATSPLATNQVAVPVGNGSTKIYRIIQK
jgi:Arc/MetJ-type ribon-helix-helix transcriptional regulator